MDKQASDTHDGEAWLEEIQQNTWILEAMPEVVQTGYLMEREPIKGCIFSCPTILSPR